MFWKKKHSEANWKTLQCFFTLRRQRCPGGGVFPPNTPDPQQSTTRLQENVQPGCQQQNLTSEGRSQCLRNKGFTVGWLLPLMLQAVVSRTIDRGSALASISFFLEAVLVSIHICWGMYLRVCVTGKSEHEISYLSSLPFLLHAD